MRLLNFNLFTCIANWWLRQPHPAKLSLYCGLIVGFFSHLFIYTSRYFGGDEMGLIFSDYPTIGTGRWLSHIITMLNLGYVMPYTNGIFTTLFLAFSAFFTTKLFCVKSKTAAILIAGVLTTFPSIAIINLYVNNTANHHFAVLLATLAVFITVRHRLGFLAGGILGMMSLAIYQAKFSVALMLCLTYLVMKLLDESSSLKEISGYIGRFAALAACSMVCYAISLPIAFNYYGASFDGYRGFSPGSVSGRLLSIRGFYHAVQKTYRNYYHAFFGDADFYLVTEGLTRAYVLLIILSLFFLAMIIVKRKTYKTLWRLPAALALIALIPFASNFANFVDNDEAYSIMIYAFSLTFVFMIVLCENCATLVPLVRTVFFSCMVFVICHFVIGNNAYYLKAYFLNQRTASVTTRVLARIDPFLSEQGDKRIGIFGGLPDEGAMHREQELPEGRHAARLGGIHGACRGCASLAGGQSGLFSPERDD